MPEIDLVVRDAAGNKSAPRRVSWTVGAVNDMTEAWFKANTGWVRTGVTLTTAANVSTTGNGQIIDSLDITGTLTVNHTGCTVKRSRLRTGSISGLSGKSLTLEDCELGYQTNVIGSGLPVPGGNTGGSGTTMRRCYMHGAREGPRTGGWTIIDCYFTDFRVVSGDHVDGVQRYAPGSTSNDTFTHTWIDISGASGGNAALFYADNWKGTLTVDRCYFKGGNAAFRVHESGKLICTNSMMGSTNFTAAVKTGWVFTGNTNLNGQPIGL